jgi:hypothetical protein
MLPPVFTSTTDQHPQPSAIDQPKPSQGSSTYRIPQPFNSIEVTDLQEENARLRAQLQQVRQAALERENEELQQQIRKLRAIPASTLSQGPQTSNIPLSLVT